MITERRCIEYDWVETNDGTSGGGPGSPSDDPLPCDPTGTEPCYDDGGGGSIQPPEPYPCDEDAIELMKNTASVDYMVIIDPKYRILVNQNGDVIAEADRCGY